MRNTQFWPEDKVTIMGNDEGIKPGEVGVVISRWIDTIYAIRMEDGSFHWVDSTVIGSIDPAHHNILVGDIVKITSNRRNHPYLKVGNLVQVVKIIENADYYKVFVNDEFYWLAGYELAPYLPDYAQ